MDGGIGVGPLGDTQEQEGKDKSPGLGDSRTKGHVKWEGEEGDPGVLEVGGVGGNKEPCLVKEWGPEMRGSPRGGRRGAGSGRPTSELPFLPPVCRP